jgi:hypothetical protein
LFGGFDGVFFRTGLLAGSIAGFLAAFLAGAAFLRVGGIF